MSGELDRLARKRTLRAAGLMSGTSADGVSAAIVDLRASADGAIRARLLAHDTFSYAPALRERVFRVFDFAAARVEDLCDLNFALGESFARAVLRLCGKAGIPLGSLDLIGSHGQTVCHLPRGLPGGGTRRRSTLQIGEPCVIAERTGVLTVADFRPRDIAAGGEGAPLVPYTDWLLFRHPRRNRVIQNIGGIANATWLPAGGGVEETLAFDTGPGNMVMDRIAWLASNGRMTFDRNGRLAAQGTVHDALLGDLMRHPFLLRRPPKSTGREEFGAAFSDALYVRCRKRRMKTEDILATITAFTARSIGDAFRRFLPGRVDEVFLCGGGARNPTLVRMLVESVKPARARLMDELGISAEAKEAVSFAILACETVRGRPGNVPSATGARSRVVLGKIIPGKGGRQ